ncbi:hypothetical protein FSP39_001491 [Pinctada imbricata]|uniref:Uncharacterized protein n=1 Tax=Pinctada imbricata TaxID=66713 RepID=A0AA89BW43_PINIB|nr:hypothetical protein FSP39_001491 [Pinctada imbricata]
MIAFKIPRQRLYYWIKALSILYYEHYGNQSKYNVNCYDDKQNNNLKAIVIEVEEDINLSFKITLFVTTGTLQVQGNKTDIFVNDFQSLMSLVNRKEEQNRSLESQSEANNISDNENISDTNSVETDDGSEETTMKMLNTNIVEIQTPVASPVRTPVTIRKLPKTPDEKIMSHIGRIEDGLLTAFNRGMSSLEDDTNVQ